MRERMEVKELVENKIEKRFTEPKFGVKELYQKIGFCRSYFYETVYQKFGISPIKLIEGKRIVRAIKLIMIERRLYDVARKSGFSNLRSCTRAFKRQFNICPRDFKKMLLDCALQNRSNYCDSCMYKNRTK